MIDPDGDVMVGKYVIDIDGSGGVRPSAKRRGKAGYISDGNGWGG